MIDKMTASWLAVGRRIWAFRERIFLGTFVFGLVIVSVFPLGIDSQVMGASLADSPEELAVSFGLSDAGSYLKASIELNQLGGLTSDKYWVINLWPPGMVWLNGALISLFGSSYAVAYALLVTLFWGTFFTLFALRLLKIWGIVASALGSALLILAGPFQNWIFDNGLFYAEGWSQGFFLIGLISLVHASRAEQTVAVVAYGVIAGTSIAIAAYFRATFSIVEVLLLGCSLLAVSVWLLAARVKTWASHRGPVGKLVIALSSTWASMFLLMEPWLQWTTHVIPRVRMWTGVSANMIRDVWAKRSEYPSFLSTLIDF